MSNPVLEVYLLWAVVSITALLGKETALTFCDIDTGAAFPS